MKKRKISAIIVALVFSILLGTTRADIEKIAIPCDKGLCFYWWPKIGPADGWYHDRESSLEYGANNLVPDGFTFADAEVIIYAIAVYKPRMPEMTSVEIVIANDKKTFLEADPSITITEVSPCVTADGQKLRSFTFFPKDKGNWERVSYGEEGEFFLIFTLSSRTKSGFDTTIPTYESMIKHYKEKS